MKVMSYLKSGTRFILITCGVILLTSVTIDAARTVGGNSFTALGILSQKFTAESCPKEMATITTGTGDTLCVDRYEASIGESCIIDEPKSTTDTTRNIADKACRAVSEAGSIPWTFVTQSQAIQLCAKSGKRLPTSEEWFIASLGTSDSEEYCNLNGDLRDTGVYEDCVSGSGVFDMIGNVWELTSDEVSDGVYEGIVLPEQGYVHIVNNGGAILETNSEPSHIYNDDYFWTASSGRSGIMKGGYYASKTDGGIYATHAGLESNFASAAIGFRCVK
jgi:hypothetical protein